MLIIKQLYYFVLFVVSGSCERKNWWESFNSRGWSNCSSTRPFIKGLFRTKISTPSRLEDGLYHLEEAKCCEGFKNVKSDCVEKNWTSSFDK